MRQFPDFQRSNDDKSYSLPTISWNAKICRVYKIDQLQSVNWHNHKSLLELDKKNFYLSSQLESDPSFKYTKYQFILDEFAKVTFKWFDPTSSMNSLKFQKKDFDSKKYFQDICGIYERTIQKTVDCESENKDGDSQNIKK